MNALRYVGLFVMMAMLGDLFFARAAQSKECTKFVVVFNEKLTSVPEGVYVGNKMIGIARIAENGRAGLKELVICIENEHAGNIEKNSICYLSGGKLMIYNVWSTGVALREGDSLDGFPSRNSVYMYEARMMFDAAMEYVLLFVREQLGSLFGEVGMQNKKL